MALAKHDLNAECTEYYLRLLDLSSFIKDQLATWDRLEKDSTESWYSTYCEGRVDTLLRVQRYLEVQVEDCNVKTLGSYL